MRKLVRVNRPFGIGFSFFELLFVLCATVFYINFEIQAQFSLLAPFISLAYIGYCMLVEPRYRILIVKFLLSIFFLILLFVTLTDATSVGNVNNRFLKIIYAKFAQWVLVFFPLFLFYRTYTKATRKQILLILFVGLLNAIMLVQTSLKIIEINPTILHSMNADRLEEAGVNLQGFSFVYAFTFLSLTCYICFKYNRNILVKYLSLFLLLYSVYFMFSTQFALSLVTTFVSFIYLNMSLSRGKVKSIRIISIFILLSLLPFILKFLISISDMELLNVRLREIYDTLTFNKGNSEESDLHSRLDLYWKSIVAFLSSPILGNRSLDFDPHSTFFSILADLGILGGILIYKLFTKSFNFMKLNLGKMFVFYKPLICQILLMGFTNPIHSSPSNYIMLWFICPLLIKLFIDNKLYYVNK